MALPSRYVHRSGHPPSHEQEAPQPRITLTTLQLSTASQPTLKSALSAITVHLVPMGYSVGRLEELTANYRLQCPFQSSLLTS